MAHEESKPSRSLLWRFGHFVLVTAISSAVLMLLLSGIAHTKAKPYLESLSEKTGDDLRELAPMAIGQRYLDILAHRMNPCFDLPYAMAKQCYDTHPIGSSGGSNLLNVMAAFLSLLRQIFSESWLQSIINIAQLIAGLIIAVTLLSVLRMRSFALHPFFPMVFIPLWIGAACVFSYVLALIAHLGVSVLNDALPQQTGLSLASGAWGGVVISWSSHTFEDMLSHGTGHVVEKALKKVIRFDR